MPENHQESVRTPKTAFRDSLLNTFRPNRNGAKRGVSTRKKVMAAAVATGALAAVGQPLAANAGNPEEPQKAQAASVEYLGAAPANNSLQEAQKLDKSKAIEQARADEAAAEKAAAQPAPQARAIVPAAAQKPAPEYVKPTEGRFSSGFGARGGSSHKGVDIANSIGTPIKSVADGKVISAGPASGFGQWVRVQHNDGTITVYGHINTIDASVGEKVSAGEQIATLGNKGQSTGPHLHFEVIDDGQKINPLPWLESKNISVK